MLPYAGPIADESDLAAALRRRVDEANVSRAELDAELDLPGGYMSKRLTVPPIRYFGPGAFWDACEIMGLAVLLVEDPAARARYAARLKQRSKPQAVQGPDHWRTTQARKACPWLITVKTASDLGRRGAIARIASQSPSRRRAIAKKAARARWARARTTTD